LHGMIASQCIYIYCAICTPLLLYVIMYIIWMYYVYLLFVISIVYIFYEYWYWSVNKSVIENTLLLLLLSLLVWHPSAPCKPRVLTKLKPEFQSWAFFLILDSLTMSTLSVLSPYSLHLIDIFAHCNIEGGCYLRLELLTDW
jgi:hypothetical protein